MAALEEALGKDWPEIFTTDQGSQFTNEAFTGLLFDPGIQVSVDGKGRYRDNIFVERLWWSVKYAEAYLKANQTVAEARAGIVLTWSSTTRRGLNRTWATARQLKCTSKGTCEIGA